MRRIPCAVFPCVNDAAARRAALKMEMPHATVIYIDTNGQTQIDRLSILAIPKEATCPAMR